VILIKVCSSPDNNEETTSPAGERGERRGKVHDETAAAAAVDGNHARRHVAPAAHRLA
jgi:hypothetical protein